MTIQAVTRMNNEIMSRMMGPLFVSKLHQTMRSNSFLLLLSEDVIPSLLKDTVLRTFSFCICIFCGFILLLKGVIGSTEIQNCPKNISWRRRTMRIWFENCVITFYNVVNSYKYWYHEYICSFHLTVSQQEII